VERYRQFWEESFDRLDDYLQELKREGSGNKNLKNKAKESKHVRTGRKK
jgi:hypothetical protein